MPLVPPTPPSSSSSSPSNPDYIHTTSFSFLDPHGRTLLLRGVNLSGASKAPLSQPSQRLEGFWESAERGGESFIGRPLRLEDGSADVHLARLRGWGFNLIRYPFTWEALEHAGPGKYDYEFMDYTIQVLLKCKEYGFRVYMDPHQDTWSRFSGGSGAPFWTLPACGINPRNITATQAAILHCEYTPPSSSSGSPSDGDPPSPAPAPESLPAMIWSTNYGRLLSQTLFTLFFAGRDFAPKCIIDGVNIQDYLQSHYLNAIAELAKRISQYNNSSGELLDSTIIGWDSLNEPFEGLVSWPDLTQNPPKQGSTLKKGTYPTPAQGMRLGMGRKETVECWAFGSMGPRREGSVVVDPRGRKVWADPVDLENPNGIEELGCTTTTGELPDGTHPRWGWKRDVESWPLGTCIWALHGVWDVETGYVLRPDYFKYRYTQTPSPTTPGEILEVRTEVDFLTDYWKPHWLAYSHTIRTHHPHAMIFVQPPVFAVPPSLSLSETRARCVYSPHYYDGLTLITRHWNWFNADALGLLRGKYGSSLGAVKVGEGAIRKSLWEQMGYLREDVGRLGGRGEGGGSSSSSSSSSSSTPNPDQADRDEADRDTPSWTPPQPYPGLGEYPTLIGEIGTPFDMDGKRSYGWTDGGKYRGDYGPQERALDASLQGCDARDAVPKGVLVKGKQTKTVEEVEGDGEEDEEDRQRRRQEGSLSWTVWTYVPDDHSHEWGDGWNLEDLSLWSRDDLDLESDADAESDVDADSGAEEAMDDDADSVQLKDASHPETDTDREEDVGDDEDALNSRALLLLNSSAVNVDGGGGKGGKRAASARKNSAGRVRRQPSKKAPMSTGHGMQVSTSVMSSALSLDTLDADGHVHEHGHGARLARPNQNRSRRSSISSSTSTLSSSNHSLSSPTPLKPSRSRSLTRTSTHNPLRLAGYTPHQSPYTFLTSGARAVRAFARPWPVKVVGKAVEVRFDVAKGVFWMKVRVGWEDRPQNVQDGEGKERLGTEVYLPLVHYAHERLVDGSWEREERARARLRAGEKEAGAAADAVLGAGAEAEAQGEADADAASGSGGSSTVAGSIHEDHDNEQDQMPPSMTASISIDKPHPQSRFGFGTSDPAPLLIRDTTPDLIDVEVKVSGGTYEVRGQGLVWWYDVPPPPPSVSSFASSSAGAWASGVDVSSGSTSASRPSKGPKSGEGEKWEYTIEVKRRGGALPSPNKPKPQPTPKPKPKAKSGSDSSNSKSGAGDKELRGRQGPGRLGGSTRDGRGRGRGGREQSWLERICCPEDGGLFGLGCVVA